MQNVEFEPLQEADLQSDSACLKRTFKCPAEAKGVEISRRMDNENYDSALVRLSKFIGGSWTATQSHRSPEYFASDGLHNFPCHHVCWKEMCPSPQGAKNL